MSTATFEKLNHQANHERFAASCYTAMAYWCEAHDYEGFAEFFHKQAEEELEHAEKFFGHLIDRGVQPMLTALDEPLNQFSSLSELAERSLYLEQENSKGIVACYEAALANKDYASHSLLLWFISEQVEEEAWANKMIVLVRRNECPGALYALDRHIVKELAE